MALLGSQFALRPILLAVTHFEQLQARVLGYVFLMKSITMFDFHQWWRWSVWLQAPSLPYSSLEVTVLPAVNSDRVLHSNHSPL
jgi:hypothetical protein